MLFQDPGSGQGGTVVLTGANGSVGLAAAEHLLKSYPQYHAVFTVRDAADTDLNTRKLRSIISNYPQAKAKASIHQVDLADLSAVHEFARAISSSVAAGQYPRVQSIICNAAYWDLTHDSELTVDGYDKTIQVSFIAHAALVLRLLDSFAEAGRIVLFSSIGHYRKPNAMTSLLPVIPDGTDSILHPGPGPDKKAQGFQRYATSKLLLTTWMYPSMTTCNRTQGSRVSRSWPSTQAGLATLECLPPGHRASEALAQSRIVQFRLGPKIVYFVSGEKNTQVIFGPPHIVDPHMFHILLMEKQWGMPRDEIDMFRNDTSGRLQVPCPGTEDILPQDRHWYNHHQIYAKFLSSAKYTEILADTFLRLFSERLDRQSSAEWTTIELFDFLKLDMVESAVESMFGSRILELNPDLVKSYWKFDEAAGVLVWGLPRWIKPGPYNAQERLHDMVHKQVEEAWEKFDWNGPEAGSDWDPFWGSRFSQVKQAFTFDEVSGKPSIDVHKLLSLPRLLSVYTEVMRMHISFNITREVQNDITIDGYRVAKNSLIQSPSQIAHYDESAWGENGHPATAFWAERHLQYQRDDGGVLRPHFSVKARPTSFFPFGGGYALCPGRHFAKREIMMATAIIVAKFDIELVGWVAADGSLMEGPAMNDGRYAGAVAMPPDRDMRVRWRRLW
ncbi:cytochrome P450 [Apiospora hydei]|uniref:Cytochrome P450 n=1 Tax=Apiospora hydei TaxID=1337664 RepID=A0ABR1UUA7_9PEZI